MKPKSCPQIYCGETSVTLNYDFGDPFLFEYEVVIDEDVFYDFVAESSTRPRFTPEGESIPFTIREVPCTPTEIVAILSFIKNMDLEESIVETIKESDDWLKDYFHDAARDAYDDQYK